MKKLIQAIFLCLPLLIMAQEENKPSADRILSIVDSTHVNNMILTQTFEVNVPLDSVWNAYTTVKGWESWATAMARIDFKINGLIQTNYSKEAKIGDEGTITLHIINYIP